MRKRGQPSWEPVFPGISLDDFASFFFLDLSLTQRSETNVIHNCSTFFTRLKFLYWKSNWNWGCKHFFLSIIVSMKEAPRLSDYSRTITFPTRWGSGSTSRGPGKGARSHRACAGVELPFDSCGVTAGDIPTGQVKTGGYIGDGTNETGNCWRSEKQVQVLLRRLQMKCNMLISSYGKKL